MSSKKLGWPEILEMYGENPEEVAALREVGEDMEALEARVEELEGALRRIEERKPYPPTWAGHNVNLIQASRQIARAALSDTGEGK